MGIGSSSNMVNFPVNHVGRYFSRKVRSVARDEFSNTCRVGSAATFLLVGGIHNL